MPLRWKDGNKVLFYLGIFILLLLGTFKMAPTSALLILLGVLVFLLGAKNLYFFYESRKTGVYHIKLETCIKRMGYEKGLLYYAIFMVTSFLVMGLILIIYGAAMF